MLIHRKILLDPDPAITPTGGLGAKQTGDSTVDPKLANKTLADVVKETIKARGDKISSDATGDTEPPDKTGEASHETENKDIQNPELSLLDKEKTSEATSEENTTTEEAEADAEVKPEGEAEADADPEKGPVPYERFEEVNTKYRQLESEVVSLRSTANTYQQLVGYCQQNGISPQQFNEVLEVQALLNNDPEKALPRLLTLVETLQGYTGTKLPEDIQKEVDDGTITLTRARELASYRAKQRMQESKFENFQRAQQQEQAQRFQAQMSSAVTSWTEAKKKTNPDFAPRKPDEPKGLYEFVTESFNYLMTARNADGSLVNPVRTTDELTALLNKAYTETTRALAPRTPKAKTRPVLTSTSSGRAAPGETDPAKAKTLAEAVAIQARKHGIVVNAS